MKRLILFLLGLIPASALAQPTTAAWVQAVATGGFEARLITSETSCPVLHTSNGDTPMAVRAATSDKFWLTCTAPIAPGTTSASIGGKPLPLPVADPRRILVVGDTGCRLKGAILQDCNTPQMWPFPQVAIAAAKMKPDLVIHVGDYLYRETPCPPGDAGCAGSPYGDNSPAWQADFFAPAAPLLAAAPIVLARGNHEDCSREGPGWLRLMGPGTFDPAAPCQVHVPLFTVDLGGERLAVLDDAVSGETDLDPAMARTYAAEIGGLAAQPAPVWFIHHRPTWAAITGPLGLPIGGNLTLIEASKINAAKGQPMMPPSVALQLSGHIHTFENLNYDNDIPPQIVAGNGGDLLDVTPKDLRGAFFQGSADVHVREGLSVGGFGFLMMTRSGEGWTIDLYDSAGNQTRTCRFIMTGNPGAGAKVGRLYCPTAK